MTYAITRASGRLGRLAAERLLDRVDPSEVVLLTRLPGSLENFAARGVTVRSCDFTDRTSLGAAFTAVDRALLVSMDATGARLDPQRAAIGAARAAGVKLIAYTSVTHPTPDNPEVVVPDHLGTEEHLRASAVNWIMLRNNAYAALQIDGLRHAAHRQFVTNMGDGRVAYVTRADCAAAAVGVLLSDTYNVDYDITGPEALGAGDLAGLASIIADRAVQVVNLDDSAFMTRLRQAGLPEATARLITSIGVSSRNGYRAEVSTAVSELAGTDPTPLRDLLP
jgi:NAD(P)H dehydrogenase (quinone)